jgi:hypothetical protein
MIKLFLLIFVIAIVIATGWAVGTVVCIGFDWLFEFYEKRKYRK